MPEITMNGVDTAALSAVGLYIGLNLILMLALAINVIRHRGSTKTMIGDGGHEKMVCATRAHANATEWIPPFLIGLTVIAFLGAPVLAIHVLGASFTIARIAHGYGLAGNPGRSFGRFAGTLISMIAYLVLGLGLIVHSVLALL